MVTSFSTPRARNWHVLVRMKCAPLFSPLSLSLSLSCDIHSQWSETNSKLFVPRCEVAEHTKVGRRRTPVTCRGGEMQSGFGKTRSYSRLGAALCISGNRTFCQLAREREWEWVAQNLHGNSPPLVIPQRSGWLLSARPAPLWKSKKYGDIVIFQLLTFSARGVVFHCWDSTIFLFYLSFWLHDYFCPAWVDEAAAREDFIAQHEYFANCIFNATRTKGEIGLIFEYTH